LRNKNEAENLRAKSRKLYFSDSGATFWAGMGLGESGGRSRGFELRILGVWSTFGRPLVLEAVLVV
jgi:hypothetical protein